MVKVRKKMLDKPYFVSVEVEGIEKDKIKTLFVKGSFSLNEIKNILEKDVDIKRIYFGACNQSKIDNKELFEFLSTIDVNKYIIVAEYEIDEIFKIPAYILSNHYIHKIFTLKTNNLTLSNINQVSLKIESIDGIFISDSFSYNDWEKYMVDYKK